MKSIDIILLLIILAIICLAVAYIVKAKKSGVKCIGCSAAGNCSSHNHSAGAGCGCGCGGGGESGCGCHIDK